MASNLPAEEFRLRVGSIGRIDENGRLKASIGFTTISQKKMMNCSNGAERKSKLVVDIDATTQAHVTRIMAAYPRLVDTVSGRSGSDPLVIALAASANPMMTVVTEEHSVKVRIPDVCNTEKIDFCGLADLIERENWQFS
jgi:hypothetical protein